MDVQNTLAAPVDHDVVLPLTTREDPPTGRDKFPIPIALGETLVGSVDARGFDLPSSERNTERGFDSIRYYQLTLDAPTTVRITLRITDGPFGATGEAPNDLDLRVLTVDNGVRARGIGGILRDGGHPGVFARRRARDRGVRILHDVPRRHRRERRGVHVGGRRMIRKRRGLVTFRPAVAFRMAAIVAACFCGSGCSGGETTDSRRSEGASAGEDRADALKAHSEEHEGSCKMRSNLSLEFEEPAAVEVGSAMPLALGIRGDGGAKVNVRFVATEGMELSTQGADVELDEGGEASLPIDVTIPRPNGCHLVAIVTTEDGRSQEIRCSFGGPEPGERALETLPDGRKVRVDRGR